MSNQTSPLSALALAVFGVNQALLDDGDELAGRRGLTSAKWKVLGAIALNAGPLTAPSIGRAMGLTRQGAQKQLDALTSGRFVARKPNQADARAPLYELTGKGKRVFEVISEEWNARTTQLMRRLTEHELLTAAKTLGRLREAISTTPQRRES
jgi:DNA-binding MarR family transcriptional regulator